jgi:hypothetical protein
MGIRVANISGSTRSFAETIVTLHLTDGEFDIYLPEFTFDWEDNIFFWVAESGSTYYANDTLAPGWPNIDAIGAMTDPSSYLARAAIPEPATIILLSLGAALIVKKR